MKRYLAFLPALLMVIVLSSCGNENDLPDVNFKVSFENATLSDGTLYIVQGEPLVFNSLTVSAVNSKHNAIISNVVYYWDYIPASNILIVEPFSREFDTSLYSVGPHSIQVVCNVFEVDCTPAVATLNFNVEIVKSAADLPEVDDNDGTLTPVSVIENASD